MPKKQVGILLKDMNKSVCQYCKEVKSTSNMKRHEQSCKDNPNRELKKRKEPLDYEKLNKNIKKCQYCGQSFHPAGIGKHEQYCSENKSAKSSYKNEKSWKCKYCGAIFFNNKVKVKHERRCPLNPNMEIAKDLDNFERLRILKDLFPEIYDFLPSVAIKNFLDNKPLKNEV